MFRYSIHLRSSVLVHSGISMYPCYSCYLYSRKFMVQFYIHEYARYKTGIIIEYSRMYSMKILELF